ncbi:MAG: dpaB [Anaerocolumna sp.]|jgi:dipicolinate synthase subunit B|nr:dpaB [Anaerocolumna sp.]
MDLANKSIGIALTGSFCTFDNVFQEVEHLLDKNANIYSIFSFNSQKINSRFGNASDFIDKMISLTGNSPIMTIEDAEPIGPKNYLDILAIIPCTGNTLAKLANGITDTPVLMAAKAHLRNGKPLVISVSTNDALSMNLKNIGTLLNSKNVYFIPFGQDNPMAKPNSMIAHTNLLIETLENALDGKQLQPIVRSPF